MNLDALETPALLLDKAKFENNLKMMHAHLKSLGVPLRPHGKSAKCIHPLKRAIEGQPGGITVSTLKEAEYYFENGIKDILYGVGIAPIKLDRVAKLIAKGCDLTVLVDSLEQAQLVAPKAAALGLNLPVLIEIDCDGHRSGITKEDAELIEVGQFLEEASGVNLKGLLTHAGDSYTCTSVDEIRVHARREREEIVACAQRLRAAGLTCDAVSIGSSPTARYAEDLKGVTEVRAGVFMFFDLFMTGLGVCAIEDVSVSVLASVIGHQKKKGWVIVDAGWMALSRDRGTANQKIDRGYGVVCDLQGHPNEDLVVQNANQEHGVIASTSGAPIDWDHFPVGAKVRILPNHACATGAQHDRYHVLNAKGEVEEEWPRINGWI